MTCAEFVELVTDYLEGEHPPGFVEHLDSCPGCGPYLDQIVTTTRLLSGSGARRGTAGAGRRSGSGTASHRR